MHCTCCNTGPALFSSYFWLHSVLSGSCSFGFTISICPLCFPFEMPSLLCWRFVSKLAQWLTGSFFLSFFSSHTWMCSTDPSHLPEPWSPPCGVGATQWWEGSRGCSGCAKVFSTFGWILNCNVWKNLTSIFYEWRCVGAAVGGAEAEGD